MESRRQDEVLSSHQPACGVVTPTITSLGTAQVTCIGANVAEVSGVDGMVHAVVRVGVDEVCGVDSDAE